MKRQYPKGSCVFRCVLVFHSFSRIEPHRFALLGSIVSYLAVLANTTVTGADMAAVLQN
jgi:hypothetical protein